ncbi:MAG TPA: phosphotransferase [Acidimicrobiia bacterium]
MKASPLARLTRLQPPPSVTAKLGPDRGDLSLRRAWPERDGRLTLEYLTADGEIVAARKFGSSHSEEAALHSAAQQLMRRYGSGSVGVLPELGMVLQGGGADLRLRSLAWLLENEGEDLVAHRAERRAVIRRSSGHTFVYAKLVRRSRVDMQVRRARALTGAPLRLPGLLATSREDGLTVWSALSGRPLGEAIGQSPADVGRRVGETIRALHDFVPSTDLPIHGPGEEVSVVEDWLQRLAGHSSAPDPSRHLTELRDRLASSTTVLTPLHRDLHDGQIAVDDSGEVGLLDLDTLSFGEAALDLANLLVHLELGVLLGRWSPSAARTCGDALLDGYSPSAETMKRIVPYAAATRLRLVCVYAFRPGPDPTAGLLESIWSLPPADSRLQMSELTGKAGR